MGYLRQALKPMLYDDEELETQRQNKINPVAATARSAKAKAKAAQHHSEDALSMHSLHTLLQDLATLTDNIVQIVGQTLFR